MTGHAASINGTRGMRRAFCTWGLSSSRAMNLRMKRRSSPSSPTIRCNAAERTVELRTSSRTSDSSGATMSHTIVTGSSSRVRTVRGITTSASKRIWSTRRSRSKVTATGTKTLKPERPSSSSWPKDGWK